MAETNGRYRGTFLAVTPAYGFFKNVKDPQGNGHPDVFCRVSAVKNFGNGRHVLDTMNGCVCTFLVQESHAPAHAGKKEAVEVSDCSPRTPCS